MTAVRLTNDRPGTSDRVPGQAPAARREKYLRELWDRSAEPYRRHVDKFATHRQISTLLFSAVTVPANRILDFGCGPGNSTRLLRQHFPTAALAGLDSAPAMVDLARRLTRPEARITYACGDARAYRATGPDPVDVVVCSNSLFHVEDKADLLDELHALLTPGGQVVFSVYETVFTPSEPLRWPYEATAPGDPVMAELLEALRGVGYDAPGRGEDREVLTEAGLARLAGKHGFGMRCGGLLRLRRTAAERLSFLAVPAVAAEVFPGVPPETVAAAVARVEVSASAKPLERIVYALIADRTP